MRCPASGCSRSNRSRIAASTGICRSAHAIRRTPSGASARSFTSYRSVVAIDPLSRCVVGQAASGSRGAVRACAAPTRPTQVRCRRSPGCSSRRARSRRRRGARARGEAEGRTRARRARRRSAARRSVSALQLVELADAVAAVARVGPCRDDEALLLQVAEHARRPAGATARLADGHPCLHAPNLIRVVSRSRQAAGSRRGTGVEWTIDVVVCPCGVKRSRTSSSSSIERRWRRRGSSRRP